MKKEGVFIILLLVLALVLYLFSSNKLTGNIVSDRGLVAHINFDKNIGKPLDYLEYDDSGKGTHLYLMNDAHTIEYDKKRGRVLLLDGADDYAYAQDNVNVDLANRFTVASWINTKNENSIGTILSKEELGVDSFGSYNIYVAKNLFKYEVDKASSLEAGGVSIGKWHHIAITYDIFSKPNLKMYIDGNPVQSGNVDSPRQNDRDLLVGRRGYDIGSDKGSYFNGMIDELRIYTRALDEREIKELAAIYA